jgi:hypothetical protein
MSTLETQYRKFLEANQKLKISFEEWKKVNARLVKQALINMMKDDEELGLYDEPFKHKVEVLSKEEILANRSNAYEFIDFDKQETTSEGFHRISKEIDYSEFDFISFKIGVEWQQQQDKNKYSEEDMKSSFQVGFNVGYNDEESPSYLTFEEWIKEYKKK